MIYKETPLGCSYLQCQAPLEKSQLVRSNVEHCQFEVKLRNSEELYRLILTNISDTVLMTDDAGVFTYICPNIELIFGYSSQEVEEFGNINKLLGNDIFEAEDLEKSREICNIERKITDKAGRSHTILINVKRVEIQRGRILYSCRDITDHKMAEEALRKAHEELERRVEERTAQLSESNVLLRQELIERKRTEQTLRESEKRFHLIADTAPVLLWMLDKDGSCTFFNKPWLKFTGKTLEESVGNHWADGMHPDDKKRCLDSYISAFNNRKGFRMEYRLKYVDGTYRWILDIGVPRFTPNGNFVGYIGSCIDISDRKATEEALRSSQHFNQHIADTTPSILYIYDVSEQRHAYVNRSITEILGYSPEQIQYGGTTVFQTLVYPGDIDRVNEHLQKYLTLKDDDIVEIEYRVKDAFGEWHWLYSRDTVFSRMPDGTPKQILGTATDITSRKQVEEELQQANEELSRWVDELEQRNREMTLLGEMSDFLQACLTVEEAYKALATLVEPLFSNCSGGVFMVEFSNNLVEAVATWGTPLFSKTRFTSAECWAVRRSRLHWVDQIHSGLLCQHIDRNSIPAEALCVPMMSQGKPLGLLYLSSPEPGRLTEAKQKLAVTVAEHIALAVANLKLRDTLKQESIHDPLTNLFNRRYMEESLTREIHRAFRQKQSLGVIMIDIDHFKRFNDSFGHEAGDAVLRELGSFLQQNIRNSDIACRYGGEELLLILPEASLEDTRQRAEQLREGVKCLKVEHRRQTLDSITISVGVACFPEHGLTGEVVIRAADAALYQAKREGRDRIVSASERQKSKVTSQQ